MASGIAGLQRDLAGALMQSVFGAPLTACHEIPPAPRTAQLAGPIRRR